jgi:hypothetical protein
MKVIRSYRDYYDGALSSFASEQVPLYIRKKEKVPFSEVQQIKVPPPGFYTFYADHPDDRVKQKFPWALTDGGFRTGVLGFCGKIYLVFFNDFTPSSLSFANGITYIGSQTFVEQHPRVKCVPLGLWGYLSPEAIASMEEELTTQASLQELFIRYKTPSYVFFNYPVRGGQDTHLILNPPLKELGVHSVLHPYQVAQELEMFLNGPLCDTNSPNVPVGGDSVVAKSKGFDKWSFRRPPSKKK